MYVYNAKSVYQITYDGCVLFLRVHYVLVRSLYSHVHIRSLVPVNIWIFTSSTPFAEKLVSDPGIL